MRVTYKGQEVQMAPSELPAFTYQVEDGVDLSLIKGMVSTTWKFPASLKVRSVMGTPVMSEARDNGGELIIGMAGENYVQSNARPVETDRNENRLIAIGDNASWMDKLKDTNINSLDLGVTTAIDESLQESTWVGDDNYLLFPVIDYGYLNQRLATFNVACERLRPAVKTWGIICKAFSDAGYSLSIKGTLNRYWKKFFLPNVIEDIPVAQSEIDQLTLDLSLSTPFDWTSFLALGLERFQVYVDTVDNDPSGSASPPAPGPGYLSSLAAEFEVRYSFTVTCRYAAAQPDARLFKLGVWNNTPSEILSVDIYLPGDSNTNTLTFTGSISPLPFTFAETYRLMLTRPSGTAPALFTIDSATISYVPTKISYRRFFSYQIGPSLPSRSAMDLLKDIGNTVCLRVTTDERTKTVTIRAYDDFVRPIIEGVDMTKRIDHTKAPVRIRPERARRLKFRTLNDSKDEQLKLVEDQSPPYGGYDLENTDGAGQEQTITVGYAPTISGRILENVTAPIMHEDDGDFQVDVYKRTTRLMIHDGTKPGDWKFNSNNKTFFPNCYYALPGERFNLAFGRETRFGDTGPGTVDRFWLNRLRRFFKSDVYRINLMHYDDELMGIDFGVPRLVHDGHEPGWYLLQKINQKRFGTHETTATELIQY